MSLKDRFYKKYNSLTFDAKRATALMFHSTPMSWNVIWVEIISDTRISIMLLEELDKKKLI